MDLYQNKKFIPMLLSEEKEAFNDPDYLFELKFDGTRTIIYVDPDNILIKNRRGVILNQTYPELLAIKKLVRKKVIFDGEIILMDNGKPSFEKLQLRALLKDKMRISYYMKKMPVQFIAYDILYDGEDITNLTLIDRKKKLAKYPDNETFIKTKYIHEKGILLFKETKKHGLEGIIAKKNDSIYQINQRTKDWFKIKNMRLESFYIGGYKESKTHLSLLLIDQINKEYVGKVSISKTNPDYLLIKKIPLNKKIMFKEDFIHIKLRLTCFVEYMNRTKNGSLRQPIYRGLNL